MTIPPNTPDTPLTDGRLTELDELHAAATAGPWSYTDSAAIIAPLTETLIADVWEPTAASRNGEFIEAAREAMPALVAEVRRLRAPRRALTENEHSAAWQAIEGAAGEEDADPGTILAAVLDRLGIVAPGQEQPAGEQAAESCGKCRQPFDPTDTRFDGHAQHKLTPYCRRCVDLCHDNESADHRCVICA